MAKSLALRLVMDSRHRVKRVVVETWNEGREVGYLNVSEVRFESTANDPDGWWTVRVGGTDVEIEHG